MADGDASKASKRRSLLMPKGTMVGASASRIASPTKQQRPLSMIGSLGGSIATSASRMQLAGVKETDAAAGNVQVVGPSAGLRKPATRASSDAVKPGTGIARAGSLRKPNFGGVGHVRQQSVTRTMPPVAERTITQPGSLPAPPYQSKDDSAAVSPSRMKSSGISRSSTTRIGHSRSGSTTVSSQAGVDEGQTVTASRLQRPASMMVAPSARPAFSTLQQHYSPLKARGPKPVSSTLIKPPTVDVPVSVSLETSLLQTHLLQLSLLHSSFKPNYNEWFASARHAMRRKFAEVAARAEIIQDQEREARGHRNLEALDVWGGGKDDSLGENIQTLAGVIQDVDVLCDENGGKIATMIRSFEHWLDAVRELWALRTQVEDRDDAEMALEFVDGLGAAWRHDLAALSRRLGNLRSMLDGLERPPTDSTAAEVVDCVSGLLHDTVEELDLMAKIERLVGEQEKAWVDARLETVISELNLGSPNGSHAVSNTHD